MKRHYFITLCLCYAFFGGGGCDSVFPGDPGTLVIEAYLDVGKPLPQISISRAAKLSASRFLPQVGVENAEVLLTLNNIEYQYHPSPSKPGVYEVVGEQSVLVSPGVSFALEVRVESEVARAVGLTPPRISIEDVRLEVSAIPVAAVLLDSLDLGLDSLNISLNTRTGFIYPVGVSIDWLDNSASERDNWVETRLQPITPFSSTIVDFFLLPSDSFPENSTVRGDSGKRTWRGVYAVPVGLESDPFPIHTLRVALSRSNEIYAQHSSSRLDPIGREPISNLNGAVGFVGGISIDSIRVNVPK